MLLWQPSLSDTRDRNQRAPVRAGIYSRRLTPVQTSLVPTHVLLHEGYTLLPKTGRLTTRVPTKGRVILAKSIRQQLPWAAFRNTPAGRRQPLFPPTQPEDVFGSLPHKGKPKTLEEMEASVFTEVKRLHARD